MSQQSDLNLKNYQPTCSIEALKARAKLYQKIRTFFAERDVLEVETPIISQAGVTDVHLASVRALRHIEGKQRIQYLQTSPEFAMKRLLASGSGPIYQICKVFRDDEHGRKHNSEFTMLEWYRPEFDLKDLMHETAELLQICLKQRFDEIRPMILSYKHAFQDRLDINPLQANLNQLKDTARRVGLTLDLGDDRLAYMDLLFSHFVEPSLGFDTLVFLTDFPPEMASLAKVRIDEDGEQVAARFEVYIEGLELANAYDELLDAQTLRQRFEA
ncbi:EF-P lysine aminoacylase GenX, partial [Salmonella enterica subsp. enterica]|nr:EF-P lysine aminoacylase GenX [Salmonella enterica subsp. enterica serovar Paratyphi A]